MKNSYTESSASHKQRTIENRNLIFSGATAPLPQIQGTPALPGSMNDAMLVRQVIAQAMRRTAISRATIADRMTELIGVPVTESQLNNFAAESRSDVRWPAEWDRAFCAAVGDNRLLTCRAELAGLKFVDATGLELMELGREYLRQKRAAAAVASLETRLAGVEL